MRINFKSLVIVNQTISRCGNTTTTTTVYDMKTIRDHRLEIPASQLLLDSSHIWRVGLLAILPILLLLFWTEWAPHQHPLLVAGVLLPWCALCYALSYSLVKMDEMERFARRERDLPAEKKMHVVEEKLWPRFAAKLNWDPLATRLADLQRRVTPMDVQELAAGLRRHLDGHSQDRGSDGGVR
jgi:hypothetical protein